MLGRYLAGGLHIFLALHGHLDAAGQKSIGMLTNIRNSLGTADFFTFDPKKSHLLHPIIFSGGIKEYWMDLEVFSNLNHSIILILSGPQASSTAKWCWTGAKNQDFGDNGVETPLKRVLPTHSSTWILSQHGHINSFILALIFFHFSSSLHPTLG